MTEGGRSTLFSARALGQRHDMKHHHRHSRSVLAVAVLIGVVAACGGTSDDSVRTATEAPAPAQESTTTAPASSELPGEPSDHPFVDDGDVLGVVAVRYDETLAIREFPGGGEAVLATLPPLTDDVVATGEHRRLGVGDFWHQVTADGVTGWADAAFLRFVSPTSQDITADVISRLGGAPVAATMESLGEVVAESFASTEGEVISRIVVVVAPTDGATGTVTFDVVDFADDSVAGDRLLVTGQQVPADTLPSTGIRATTAYELTGVERTLICYRGVTADGICV